MVGRGRRRSWRWRDTRGRRRWINIGWRWGCRIQGSSRRKEVVSIIDPDSSANPLWTPAAPQPTASKASKSARPPTHYPVQMRISAPSKGKPSSTQRNIRWCAQHRHQVKQRLQLNRTRPVHRSPYTPQQQHLYQQSLNMSRRRRRSHRLEGRISSISLLILIIISCWGCWGSRRGCSRSLSLIGVSLHWSNLDLPFNPIHITLCSQDADYFVSDYYFCATIVLNFTWFISFYFFGN